MTCAIDFSGFKKFAWEVLYRLFQDEYSRRKIVLKDVSQMRLIRLVEKATEVISRAVDGGDLKTSIVVLSRLGILDRWDPVPEVKPKDIANLRWINEWFNKG